MISLSRPALVLVMLVLTGLAGCVSVPTVGPVDPVEGQQPGCQNCVNVEVAPPQPGDDPHQIVIGYLRATSNYRPEYAVAKQFLTRSAAEIWTPEVGVTIYKGIPVQQGDNVILNGDWVGQLNADRTYTAINRNLYRNFGLVEEDGEWRIDKPPPGLMVPEFSFESFYRAYQVYFIGKYFVGDGGALVPDSIYLPSVGDPANVASALMKALLDGPSEWLAPAVASAIPPDTALSVESVTITDGVAEVRLSETLLALSDPERSLLAAQIVYTLKQASGIRSVLITVDGQPYRVPESDRNSLAIPVEEFPRDLEPVSFVTGEQLYAATVPENEIVPGNPVGLVNDAADTPGLTAMKGELGAGEHAIDSLAVSVTGTDLAVVTDDRTALGRAQTATGDVDPLTLSGVSDLLRPQFTRFGEIWAVGRNGGRQRMWVFASNDRIDVDAQVLDKGEITAFKISPDGARMAMVRTVPGGFQVGLALIVRTDKISVIDWRPLTAESGTAQFARIADIAWTDATELMVLGAPTLDANLVPIRLRDDASQITPMTTGEPSNWNARDLTVQLRTKTAIVRGADDKTWRDEGSQWTPFLEDERIRAIAYPG